MGSTYFTKCFILQESIDAEDHYGPDVPAKRENPDDDDDVFATVKGSSHKSETSDVQLFAERLAKVHQMTGQADPVYVEVFLQVHSVDPVRERLIVNRMEETLQNVLVELSTQGDLKIIDRPVGIALAPGQQTAAHASVKVGSTETGQGPVGSS